MPDCYCEISDPRKVGFWKWSDCVVKSEKCQQETLHPRIGPFPDAPVISIGLFERYKLGRASEHASWGNCHGNYSRLCVVNGWLSDTVGHNLRRVLG